MDILCLGNARCCVTGLSLSERSTATHGKGDSVDFFRCYHFLGDLLDVQQLDPRLTLCSFSPLSFRSLPPGFLVALLASPHHPFLILSDPWYSCADVRGLIREQLRHYERKPDQGGQDLLRAGV